MVFSHLPSKDLREVISVCKHWESSVREGTNVCRQVKVARKWEIKSHGDAGHELMCKLLEAAEEVEFTHAFRHARKHIETMGVVMGSNLRYLRIPDHSVHVNFLPFLASHCPSLNTLVINGEPMGRAPIDIRHPQLETLQLTSKTSRVLKIEYANLRHLSGAMATTLGLEDLNLHTLLPF